MGEKINHQDFTSKSTVTGYIVLSETPNDYLDRVIVTFDLLLTHWEYSTQYLDP